MGERTGPVSDNNTHGDRTTEIRRDIERTQREISYTIDEIQYRLSPHNMMERTKESIRRTSVEKSRGFVDKVKANPLGAAIAGVGLWMLFRGKDSDRGSYDYQVEFQPEFDVQICGCEMGAMEHHHHLYDQNVTRSARGRMSEAMGSARDAVGAATHRAGEKIGSATHRAGEAIDTAREATSRAMSNTARRASQATRRAGSRMRSAGSDIGEVMRDNPLIGGLAALAVGAVLGASIPETEKENEWYGPYRDQLADRAKEAAREGIDKAKNVAGVAAEAAKDAVRDEVGRTDRVQNVAGSPEMSSGGGSTGSRVDRPGGNAPIGSV